MTPLSLNGPPRSAVAPDSDSHGAIFWERLRTVFTPPEEDTFSDQEPRRGIVLTVCVLLSFILWLSLTLGEDRTETLQFPVEVVGLPDDRALAEVPPLHVQLRAQGNGFELIRLYYDPPTVQVGGTSEQVNVREAINLTGQANVQVVNVSPSSFRIRTEPRVERQVPIQTRVRVDVAPGHELIEEPWVTPDSAQIAGAQSIVSGVEAWPTDSSSIDNLRDTVQVKVPLADTLSRLVERRPEQVTLTAQAGRFAEATREVDVEVRGVPSDQDLVALEPSTIRVRYRVLFTQLFKAQRSSEFFASVSYDQIRSDTTGYVEPRVHVPSDLIIRDPTPSPARLRYYTYLSGS